MKFKDTEYTADSLNAMSDEDLLKLRNEVAAEMGVSEVRGFKDHAAAVEGTTKALQKFEQRQTAEANADAPKAPRVKKDKPPKEPKGPRPLAKSAMAHVVKRPTKDMFATIEKIGEHDGTQGRAHRWPNYTNGMTIVDVIETEGTEPWDVHNWVAQGIMKLVPATDEEFAERKAAWYAKHGLTDPDVAKEQKLKEREAAKAAREQAQAEKKAAADAAKAAAAEAKAAKEAAEAAST